MNKKDVLEHFGGQTATAKALDISQAAVSKWDELIPELQAARLDRITSGKLKYDPGRYHKSAAETKAA